MVLKAALVGLLLAALVAVSVAVSPRSLMPPVILAADAGHADGNGPTMVTGPRSAAPLMQAQGALAAACATGGPLGGPVGCAAAGGAFLAVYCTVYGGCPSISDVETAVDSFIDWVQDNPADFEELRQQVIAHPTYVDPTQNLLDSWRQHINSISAAGWYTGTVSGQAAMLAGPNARVGTGHAHAAAEWTGTIDANPANICRTTSGAPVMRGSIASPAHTSGYVTGLRYTVYRLSDGVVLRQGEHSQSRPSGFGTDSVLSGQSFSNVVTPPTVCAFIETPIRVLVEVIDTSTSLQSFGGFVNVQFVYQESTDGSTFASNETVTVQASAFSGAAVSPWPAEWEAPGMRVNVPADADDLAGWDTTSALPLANGTTGEVVTTPGAIPQDDPSWWEGLFGGVTGWLRAIWEKLQAMGNTLTGIASAIAALPATIAALFDPSIAWADFMSTGYPGVRDDWALVAPACYLSDVGGAVLFTSGGDSLPTLTLGLPGNTIDVELQVSDVVADITFPASTAFVAILLWLWAYSKIERPPWVSGE